MPSFLVETYLGRANGAERGRRERRARATAERMTQAGTRVTFDGSIHIPQDEMCFFVFDAPTGRDAALAAHRARLDPFRVVEAIASGKERE